VQTFPASALLSHFTNSRPKLPFSALFVVHLTRGSNHGHFGQWVSGIGPFVANSYAPMLELLPRDMLTCSQVCISINYYRNHATTSRITCSGSNHDRGGRRARAHDREPRCLAGHGRLSAESLECRRGGAEAAGGEEERR
jgi:hypothetical protein